MLVGSMAVMTAWRSEPSGWRVLTSTCSGTLAPVAVLPASLSVFFTSPCAKTWPNVTGVLICGTDAVLVNCTDVMLGNDTVLDGAGAAPAVSTAVPADSVVPPCTVPLGVAVLDSAGMTTVPVMVGAPIVTRLAGGKLGVSLLLPPHAASVAHSRVASMGCREVVRGVRISDLSIQKKLRHKNNAVWIDAE